MTTDAKPVRRRRKHAATGARIVAGSASAAAALGLMGAMAGHVAKPAAAPAPAPAVQQQQPVVVVVHRQAGATTQAAAPAPTPVRAAPVTTTRGS